MGDFSLRYDPSRLCSHVTRLAALSCALFLLGTAEAPAAGSSKKALAYDGVVKATLAKKAIDVSVPSRGTAATGGAVASADAGIRHRTAEGAIEVARNTAMMASTCGDGSVEGLEECDESSGTNGTPESCCSTTCTFVAIGTECRAAADVCDAAEQCSGSDPTCPADELQADTVVCNEAVLACDVSEYCDGMNIECPDDEIRDSDHECRPLAGACDVEEEYCDGDNKECPPDEFYLPDDEEECRAADFDCDIEEYCDGTGPDCGEDIVRPDTFTCREPAGACDLREKCNGVDPQCPGDLIKEGGDRCRKATDACDAVERCDGLTTACPADEMLPAGTVCNESLGGCDPAEKCDGMVATCPADVLSPAGTECRPAVDAQCDVAENCVGGTAACGVDVYVADGTACDDGDPATSDETCLLGFCACDGGDLDSDGTTDNCDSEDAPLDVTQLKLQETAKKPGKYSAKGTLAVGVFGPDDVFDPTHGLRVVIRGGSSFELATEFSPAECSPKKAGYICIKAPGGAKAKIRFSPRYVDGNLSSFKFKLSIRNVAIPAGVSSPYEISMRTSLLDRVADLTDCRVKKNKQICTNS